MLPRPPECTPGTSVGMLRVSYRYVVNARFGASQLPAHTASTRSSYSQRAAGANDPLLASNVPQTCTPAGLDRIINGAPGRYAHVADPAKHSFDRGIQFWLMKEARKRNPTIPLYVQMATLRTLVGLTHVPARRASAASRRAPAKTW